MSSLNGQGGGCVHCALLLARSLIFLLAGTGHCWLTGGPGPPLALLTVPRRFCGPCQTQHRWLVALRSATPDRHFSGVGQCTNVRASCAGLCAPKGGAAEVTVHAQRKRPRCHSPPAGWAARLLAELGWQPNPRARVRRTQRCPSTTLLSYLTSRPLRYRSGRAAVVSTIYSLPPESLALYQ